MGLGHSPYGISPFGVGGTGLPGGVTPPPAPPSDPNYSWMDTLLAEGTILLDWAGRRITGSDDPFFTAKFNTPFGRLVEAVMLVLGSDADVRRRGAPRLQNSHHGGWWGGDFMGLPTWGSLLWYHGQGLALAETAQAARADLHKSLKWLEDSDLVVEYEVQAGVAARSALAVRVAIRSTTDDLVTLSLPDIRI